MSFVHAVRSVHHFQQCLVVLITESAEVREGLVSRDILLVILTFIPFKQSDGRSTTDRVLGLLERSLGQYLRYQSLKRPRRQLKIKMKVDVGKTMITYVIQLLNSQTPRNE